MKDLYGRLWCVHEVDAAIEQRIKVLYGMSRELILLKGWSNLNQFTSIYVDLGKQHHKPDLRLGKDDIGARKSKIVFV